ncbi:S-adenosyl-L-methionine-dependent methyltransferase, partial [Tribonema minus]
MSPPHAAVTALVDLFCGIGGFSEGARLAGAEVALAVDSWRAALDVHASRHPDAEHWCEELGGDVAEFARRVRAAVPVGCRLHLHGSPPCQQLSSLNPGGDREEGARLVTWYLDVVDALRPDSWTMEQ